jgi:hypothetical protein
MGRVLMVADTACIRVAKEALALQARGVEVEVCGRKFGNPDVEPYLLHRSAWREPADLRARLSVETGLVHVAVEPAGLAVMVRDARPDLPIVLDVHDAEWGRLGGTGAIPAETADLEACDACVVPSRGYLEILASLRPELPARQLAPLMPEGLLPEHPTPWPRIGGWVYEGGITTRVAYRDFRALFRALAARGQVVHCYGLGDARAYDETGAIVCAKPYRRMLQDLGRYDWGMVGPAQGVDPALERAFPNKLVEFLAAGLPVCAWCCDHARELVREHGVGVYDDDQARAIELALAVGAGSPAWHEMATRARAWASEHTMEQAVDDLFGLYREAVARAGRRSGAVVEEVA